MFLDNDIYVKSLLDTMSSIKDINNLFGKKILITGATGLIGSYLVDLLMYINNYCKAKIEVYASGRNIDTACKRFVSYTENPYFTFIQYDVKEPMNCSYEFDYIIHAASNANPLYYATDPVGTMLSNFCGLNNLLVYLYHTCPDARLLYVSSGEVYGQALEELDSFTEDYSGYVNTTNSRSCYPSSKRASETLLASYISQYKVDGVIVRPCHIYGPTMTKSDNRAISQFITNGTNKENIIMKSKGEQVRSYCYVADCVAAIITVLLYGEKGEAYNIADKYSVVSIAELARTIAVLSGVKIQYELPTINESMGFTPIQRGVLNAAKLEKLGWEPKISLEEGIKQILGIR